MSHQIGFRLEAVARSAHAALRCNITISQNRGNASAREPRTYHGRGFSLWARILGRAAWSLSLHGPALISQNRRKILPATEGAPAKKVRHIAPAKALQCFACARFARDQIAKASSDLAKHMTRLEAAWEFEHKVWDRRTSSIFSRGPKQPCR